jgi:leucyl aminopeptidase (aminopeptidase T)
LAKQNNLEGIYEDVAKKILSDSVHLSPGETLTIETWTTGLPLANLLALEAKRLGAFPLTVCEDEDGYVEGVRSAPKESLGKMGKHEQALLASSDAYVFIPGPPIAGYYPKITRKEYIDSTAYNSSWYDAAKVSRLRGARVTSGYVGKDVAKLLGRKRKEIMRHQLEAALVDPPVLKANAKKVADNFKEGAEVTLHTKESELTFKLKGELEIQDGVVDDQDLQDGNNVAYVPAGYVSKDIDTITVNGAVRLSPSITRYGLLEGVEAVFDKGNFVSWKSKKNPEIIKSLGEVLPEKSRLPAYVMVGINPKMKFGFAQDRFPEGSVTVGVGFAGIARNATLEVDDKVIVKDGVILK